MFLFLASPLLPLPLLSPFDFFLFLPLLTLLSLFVLFLSSPPSSSLPPSSQFPFLFFLSLPPPFSLQLVSRISLFYFSFKQLLPLNFLFSFPCASSRSRLLLLFLPFHPHVTLSIPFPLPFLISLFPFFSFPQFPPSLSSFYTALSMAFNLYPYLPFLLDFLLHFHPKTLSISIFPVSSIRLQALRTSVPISRPISFTIQLFYKLPTVCFHCHDLPAILPAALPAHRILPFTHPPQFPLPPFPIYLFAIRSPPLSAYPSFFLSVPSSSSLSLIALSIPLFPISLPPSVYIPLPAAYQSTGARLPSVSSLPSPISHLLTCRLSPSPPANDQHHQLNLPAGEGKRGKLGQQSAFQTNTMSSAASPPCRLRRNTYNGPCKAGQ